MAKARILIVEDDRFYKEFYRDILEKEGFRLDNAHTSREAIRKLAAETFDLVISDLVLGSESGLELLTHIKKELPSLDVIMVTSMQSIRKAVDALRMGASDYLTKPVDKEELLLSIHRLLDRQQASQEHTRLIRENIHFYELLRIQKKNMAILSTLDPERVADVLLDTLIGELGAQGGSLFLVGGDDSYALAASRGVFETREEHLTLAFRTPGLRESLESGIPLFEGGEGEQWVPRAGEEGRHVILPVLHRQEVMAAVKLAPRRGDRSYVFQDIDLARNILEAGGIALRNARRNRVAESGSLQGEIEGTFSPVYFKAFSEAELAVARRYNREAAIILCRLENLQAIRRQFKDSQVRQIMGHLCDNLLEVIRETDLLARMDDDLFALFVPETDFYGALMLKKRIRAKIAKTVFPLDLKRDLIPIISLGCAACPRDGTYFQNLLEHATTRLNEERSSLFHALQVEQEDFWETIDRLLDEDVLGDVAAARPEQAALLRPITLTVAGTHLLMRSLLRDVAFFFNSRGIVYLGVGQADPASPVFVDTGSKENMAISIMALGAKGEKLWNLPHITPVFIGDPLLARHRFLLAVTEYYSYAIFLVAEGDDTFRGFHTSDDLLIMELITRLQDKYLLQRRIG